MQDKIKTNLENINQSPFMVKTVILAKTFWNIIMIIGPAALSAYLLITTLDKVVIVVGVFSGVVALAKLVSTAYKANQISKKRK